VNIVKLSRGEEETMDNYLAKLLDDVSHDETELQMEKELKKRKESELIM
jgi:hypothetical protein